MTTTVPRPRRLPRILIVEPLAAAPPRRTFQAHSVFTSLVVHLLLIFAMACVVFEPGGHLTDEQIFALIDDGGADAATFDGLDDSPILRVEAQKPPGEVPPDPNLLAERSRHGESPPSFDALALGPSIPETPPGDPAGDISGPTGPAMPDARPSGPKITAGRTGSNKSDLLKKFGGTAQTEASVRLGLKWLAKQQQKDGGWSFAGPYSDGAGFNDNRVAATSMALLAFLGAGHTHQTGDYQRQINIALNWLVDRQKNGGSFGSNTPPHHALYTHAQATIVLCEAYAMTDDDWLQPYCKSALTFAVRAQGPQGGWRYEFKGDSDTSVTGWFVMALMSGKSAGLEIPEATLRKISGFLDQVAQDYGQVYSYVPGRPATPSMTAEGLLCRMYLGWPRSNAALDGGIERLQAIAPFQARTKSYYYWYYATQVLHHAGGPAWETWNEAMREQLPAAQITDGPESGSWEPGGVMTDRMAGRLYATCMSLYCLEVYYRHLPIYESPWDERRAKP